MEAAKQAPYRTLKNMILASMIFVPAIPFFCAVSIGYYYFTSSLEKQTIATMDRIVGDHGSMIEMFLSERKADLALVANVYKFQQISRPETLKAVFKHLQDKSNAFVDLGVFDESGTHVAYVGPYELAGKNYKGTDWFKRVIERGYYISDIFLGYRKVPHFIIALTRQEDDRTWIIRATIDTLAFSEMVERVRIGKTGEAYIVNREGLFQSQRRSGGVLLEKDADSAMYLTPHQGIRILVKDDVQGESYLWATAWLKGGDWLLVVRQEKADAFRSLRSAAYLVILIAILGGVLIVGMAFYVTGRIIARMAAADKEKQELNQQLIIAGRLAEIGEMSAGFAHEINNPLQIIRAEQTLIETILGEMQETGELKEGENLAEVRDSVNQIKVQVDRCGAITQGILKFARQKEPVSARVDLRQYMDEIVALVAKKASVDGITIKQEIAEDVPAIQADPGQLQQVLVNLVNNAIDAITQTSRTQAGEIKVRAASTDGGVEISVSDNGSGISPQNMEKIFTPFFTTKPVGKGTGLGLPVCYGIIEKMGGSIRVSSQEGRGTTFTINLPAGG